MDNRISYTAVGLFVIGLGAALILAFVWLATHGDEKTYLHYQVLTAESVSGLNRNASVTYRGAVVGRVASISIDRDDPAQVRLVLDIEAGTPVRTDTTAVLVTQGITGLARVELTGGSRAAPALLPAPGAPPPIIPSGPSHVASLDSALDMLVGPDQSARVARNATGARADHYPEASHRHNAHQGHSRAIRRTTSAGPPGSGTHVVRCAPRVPHS